MGSKLVSLTFRPKENEQIEAIIEVPEEPRSVIHGIVKNHNNKVVKDAVVKLFKMLDPNYPCNLVPLTHTFTDECGQFLFGPLSPHTYYVIKVWVDNIKIRQIVLTLEDNN